MRFWRRTTCTIAGATWRKTGNDPIGPSKASGMLNCMVHVLLLAVGLASVALAAPAPLQTAADNSERQGFYFHASLGPGFGWGELTYTDWALGSVGPRQLVTLKTDFSRAGVRGSRPGG